MQCNVDDFSGKSFIKLLKKYSQYKVYLYSNFNDAWDKVTDNGGTLEVRDYVKLSGMKEVPEDIEITLIATGKTIDRGLNKDNVNTLLSGKTAL